MMMAEKMEGCLGSLLNMPRKIRFEILIFPCGVSANSSAPATISVSFSRQVPRTRGKICSSLRLNACVSIVKLADMADPIVLNFYVMYLPFAELSFSSVYSLLRLPSVSSYSTLLPRPF